MIITSVIALREIELQRAAQMRVEGREIINLH